MSKGNIKTLTCDRCGYFTQGVSLEEEKNWGYVFIEDVHTRFDELRSFTELSTEGRLLSTRWEKADLCPGCKQSLLDWWNKGKK